MSSHHFVKDKQEPALLILGESTLTPDQIGQLLEWSPSIWVDNAALDYALTLGIHLDGIFYRDKHAIEKRAEELSSFLTIEYVQLQGEQCLENILQSLIERNHKAVNILGLATFSLYHLFEKSRYIDIVLFQAEQKSYIYQKKLFKKWMSKGEKLIVSGKGNFLVASSENMQQESNTSFVVTEDGIVVLEFQQLPLLITEQL